MPNFNTYLTNVTNDIINLYNYAESVDFYNPDHPNGQFFDQAFIEGWFDCGFDLPFNVGLGGISLLNVAR